MRLRRWSLPPGPRLEVGTRLLDFSLQLAINPGPRALPALFSSLLEKPDSLMHLVPPGRYLRGLTQKLGRRNLKTAANDRVSGVQHRCGALAQPVGPFPLDQECFCDVVWGRYMADGVAMCDQRVYDVLCL